MRMVIVVTIALFGGFVGGILLSDIIGIVGYLAFDRIVGITFLPIILAVICAAVAPIVDARVRRRSG